MSLLTLWMRVWVASERSVPLERLLPNSRPLPPTLLRRSTLPDLTLLRRSGSAPPAPVHQEPWERLLFPHPPAYGTSRFRAAPFPPWDSAPAPFPPCAVFFSSDSWLQSEPCPKCYRYRDTTVASPACNCRTTWDHTRAQPCKCHGNGGSSIIISRIAKAGAAFQLQGGRRFVSPLLPAPAPGKARQLCSFGASSPTGLGQTQSHRASRQC